MGYSHHSTQTLLKHSGQRGRLLTIAQGRMRKRDNEATPTVIYTYTRSHVSVRVHVYYPHVCSASVSCSSVCHADTMLTPC